MTMTVDQMAALKNALQDKLMDDVIAAGGNPVDAMHILTAAMVETQVGVAFRIGKTKLEGQDDLTGAIQRQYSKVWDYMTDAMEQVMAGLKK